MKRLILVPFYLLFLATLTACSEENPRHAADSPAPTPTGVQTAEAPAVQLPDPNGIGETQPQPSDPRVEKAKVLATALVEASRDPQAEQEVRCIPKSVAIVPQQSLEADVAGEEVYICTVSRWYNDPTTAPSGAQATETHVICNLTYGQCRYPGGPEVNESPMG